MPTTLQVLLLGPVEVRVQGLAVDVPGVRLTALLARLALVPGQVVTPGTLVEALWGEQPPGNAAGALQSLVSRLRRVLPAGVLLSRPAGYVLDIDPEAVDAVRFERALAAAREALPEPDDERRLAALEVALAWWRGPALAGLDGVPFAPAVATAWEEARLAAAELRLDLLLRCGRAEVAVGEAERLAAAHPLRESLTGWVMRALVAAGRPADALGVFERARGVLAEELGADPSPQLRELHAAILRGEGWGGASEAGSAGSERTILAVMRGESSARATSAEGRSAQAVAAHPTPAPAVPASRLRAPLTSFVGREADLTRVGDLLDEHRLVTLLGPGGSGKTRLALETSRGAEAAGLTVWWVELAPLTASAEEVAQLAGALLDDLRLRGVNLLDGRSDPRADDLTLLSRALAESALLVLDNCEHLIAAAAALADELLARCPDLTVLATSREPLAITGEALHPVTPLRLPARDAPARDAPARDAPARDAPARDAPASEVADAPAVRLFLDRAAAAVPGFALTAETEPDVVEICRRLDGLPLAIELAAARLRTLPLPLLARRLDQRFRLLTGGSRTAAPRHRTLRAVVEWSWDLMDDRERDVAEHLAIFPAGATPDAVHAVLRQGLPVADWSGATPDDVTDTLLVLADKSIVRATPTITELAGEDGIRFRMLETLREYGVERLGERDALRPARDAHAAHYCALAERTDPLLRTGEQVRAIDLLYAERENLAAAMRHAIDSRDVPTAVRTVAALGWWWQLTGAHYEGGQWLVAADDLAAEYERDLVAAPHPFDPLPESPRAAVLIMRQIFMLNTGASPELPLDEVVALLPEPGRFAHLSGHPLFALVDPVIAMLRGDHAASIAQMTEGAAATDDPWTRAMLEVLIAGTAENAGEPELEQHGYATALVMFREIGDRWGIAACVSGLGRLQTLDGDHEAAARTYEDAVAVLKEIRSRDELTEAYLRLAAARAQLGDVEATEAALAAAAEAADASSRPFTWSMSAAVRAGLAWSGGDLARAEELLRASVTFTTEGIVRPPQLRAVLRATLATFLALEGRDARGEAAQLVASAISDATLMWDMPVVATASVALAAQTHAAGDDLEAATLLGAAHAVRGRDDKGDAVLARTWDAVCSALGEAAATAAFEKGAALSRRDALVRLGLTPRE